MWTTCRIENNATTTLCLRILESPVMADSNQVSNCYRRLPQSTLSWAVNQYLAGTLLRISVQGKGASQLWSVMHQKRYYSELRRGFVKVALRSWWVIWMSLINGITFLLCKRQEIEITRQGILIRLVCHQKHFYLWRGRNFRPRSKRTLHLADSGSIEAYQESFGDGYDWWWMESARKFCYCEKLR